MQDFIHSRFESIFVFLTQLDLRVVVVSLTLVFIGYIFGNRMYWKYNSITHFAGWIALTLSALNEFCNIVLSPTSHPNEIFAGMVGVIFSGITSLTLMLSLRKDGSIRQLLKESNQEDKIGIYILVGLLAILGISEFAPWGNVIYWEYFMMGLLFIIDIIFYFAVKDEAVKAPHEQSFAFWTLLFIGVMWFNITQISFHYNSLSQLGSVGLLIYFENAILFFFCARTVFKAKYPGGIKEGLTIARSYLASS